MSIDSNQKQFFTTTKEKAAELLLQPHIGADVKSVVKDLIAIAESFRDVSDQSATQSSDVRVLKRKLELMRNGNRAANTKLLEIKKSIISMASELELINIEASKICTRHTAKDDIDAIGGTRIQDSTKKVVSAVLVLSAAMPVLADT